MKSAVAVPAPSERDSHVVARNTSVLLVRYLFNAGLNVVPVLLLPRYLGDQGLGQLQFAISFVTLFSVGIGLGTRFLLVKEVARDHSRLPFYLKSATGLRLITASVVFAIIMSFSYFTGVSGNALLLMLVAALWMIATSFSNLMASFLHGQENMSWPALADVVNKVIVVTLGTVILLTGGGVVDYAIVLLAGAAVSMALNAFYVRKSSPLGVDFHPKRLRVLLVGGSPFLLMALSATAYSYVDTVMLKYFTNYAEVGWYAAANQIYRNIEFVPAALTTAMLPTLSRIHSNDAATMSFIAKKSVTFIALVIVPMALGISLLAKTAIAILPYPDAFQNSVPLLTILALTMPITAVLTVFGTIAISMDRQKIWALGLTSTVILNIVLNALTIPYFETAYGNGGIGAALTTAVCEIFMFGLAVRLLAKQVVDHQMSTLFLKVVLCGGLMAVAGLVARSLGLNDVVVAVAAAVAYLVSILALKAVTMEDIRSLRDTVLARFKRGKSVDITYKQEARK